MNGNNNDKNMKISILLITLSLILFSCRQTNKKKTEPQLEQFTAVADSLIVETLPPMPEGEFSLTENDFGKVIELQGTSHTVDHIFKVSWCEMIALDSIEGVRIIKEALK